MSDAPGRWRREVGPLLLAAFLPLLPDLGAALPGRAYFFRDFSVTFYPLRLFVARELREGRFPFWNPYIYEGSFGLPTFYPVDLLHVFWPGPSAVSWLLTLHLPLAAVGMYCLARSLGADRVGGILAGAVYSLGGLSLSSLNLYVFLQALALAPFVVLTLLIAVRNGGRAIGVAALVLAAAISTLAVEFVAQALVIALGLALTAVPGARSLARSGMTTLLGAGIAAVPIAVTLGLLGETVRGTGFAPDVSLGYSIHPLSLLQTVVPDLYGSLADPVGAWWGGAFSSKGLPYFLSLYLGPVALALAWTGKGTLRVAPRRVLLTLAVLGLWYSLGSRGGLASVLAWIPGAGSFRFPSKAFFLPHFAIALLAGLGISQLREGRGWTPFLRATGAIALVLAIFIGVLGMTSAADLASFARVAEGDMPGIRSRIVQSSGVSLVLTLLGLACAWEGRRSPARSGSLSLLLLAMAAWDLSHAGAGMNPQMPATFYDPLPEMAALHLAGQDGGRVFSYGLDHTSSFAELRRLGPALSKGAFYLNRQLLGPYNNVLDRVEATEATDLTSFVPRARELDERFYDPAAVGQLVPWLRNAAVFRVLSVDPLDDPALRLLAKVPAVGTTVIHVYELLSPSPPSYVACRVVTQADPVAAANRPYAEGFVPDHDVVLADPGRVTCTGGTSGREGMEPGHERFFAEADGDGYLVVRGSYARGFRAWVDGRAEGVLRANGKHRAVRIPGGRHVVEFRYEPPGLEAGLAVMGAALLCLGFVTFRGSPPAVKGASG